MFGRSWYLVLGILAAMGLPYLASPTSGVRQWLGSSRSSNSSPDDARGDQPSGASASDATKDEPTAKAGPTRSPMLHPEGPPVQDLGEIFRLDATTAWVLARWPRVSTRLAALDLQGYRVPLVSGTSDGDLAGSLTYYFNPQQRVHRNTCIGTTGDARPLVAVLATRHGFIRQKTDDPSVHIYQVKEKKKAVSELRVRTSRTVTADDPHARFEVQLVIERPSKMS